MVIGCPNCHGDKLCPKHKILNSFAATSKVKLRFSGPSPPEIFVGRMGYPNIRMGVMAPTSYDTLHDEFRSAEDWSKDNLSIANVMRLRSGMVYGRSMGHVTQPAKIKSVMQELALTDKRVSSEFFLKKEPVLGRMTASSVFRPMINPAPVKKILLEDNVKVGKKVDYLINDTDALTVNVISELKKEVRGDHLQKLLSAGMLGLQKNRKMVPTRWSITAVDDMLSKQLLEKIRVYDEIDHVRVLTGSYVGNYITILILPGKFSFEGIEIWEDEENGDSSGESVFAHDFEGFTGRKKYASNVTGGYYAMRLPATEYLDRIKVQGGVLVFREITKEYYAPLGVGVVREAARRAINSEPLEFESRAAAIEYIRNNQKLRHEYLDKSWLLSEYGKQKDLQSWF
ncbi:MAG: hypothetical protein ACI83O_000502 [Patescibacteria group bacterium]|jgi:hypothetical protein